MPLVAGACLILFCIFICCSCEGPGSDGSLDPRKKKYELKEQKDKPEESGQDTTGPKDPLQRIRESGELRVGMQVGYPPFQMRDRTGRLEGLDIDLAKMAAKELSARVHIEERSWDNLMDALVSDEVDLIMSAMTITPQRNLRVMFTDPALVTGRMFLVKRGDLPEIRSAKDLNKPGFFLCSIPDGLGNLEFQEIFPRASYREFTSRAQAVDEVVAGRCKAYIDEEFAIRMACAKRSDKVASPFQRLTHEPVAFAVKPGSNHWLNWLNNFIHRIQHDGSLERLRKKWLHDYYLDLNPRALH
jgi:polar amino acid transport system substrate-binding protein